MVFQGKIYKICNDVNDLIYIGSTTQSLSKRLSQHKGNMGNPTKQNIKIYRAMNQIGIERFRIILIESRQFNNKEEMLAREDHWIQHHNSIRNGYNGIFPILNVEKERHQN